MTPDKVKELAKAHATACAMAYWQDDQGWKEHVIAAARKSASATKTELHAAIDELAKDAARLDWIEQAADKRKVEIAKSLLGTGYEIGEWPALRITVANGPLRKAIDAAMKETKCTA